MDPVLSKKANDLVAFWCSGAAILSGLPLIYLQAIRRQWVESLSIGQVMGLLIYGLILGWMSSYPFVKIKTWESPSPKD
jgi:hypothetical protein